MKRTANETATRALAVCLAGVLLAAQAARARPLTSGKVPDKATAARPGQVKLTGWLGGRVEANRTNRLRTVSLEQRLRTFQSPTERGGWSGEHIGKWLHAASIAWGYSGDAALRRRMDEAVRTLIACQAPDGYLGTYGKAHRWGGWDVWTHKYNLMGLMTYHEHTGDEAALAAARKIGDLLARTFGDGAGRRDIIRSGTHVGMAATSVLEPLLLLYRATHEPRYLELARYITRAYDQPHGPKIIATLTKTRSVARTANRKAYEMMSNLVGLCELYRSTGEAAFLAPCLYAHDDIVANQMYLTGGTSLGERFQDPHHLPNTGHVSENCAQVTWIQLCAQLLRITGEAKYADTLERVVYNHLLAAQKPSGEALCYFTPLRGRKGYGTGMSCCTSSGPRAIAMIPTLAYALRDDAVMVNFYEPSTLEAAVAGTTVTLTQRTRYPVDGQVELTVEPAREARFDLMLRIPSWCRSYKIEINGQPLDGKAVYARYHVLSRQWKRGDRVLLDLAMPAVLVKGTHTNAGLLAVQRGPLVLAFDAEHNPGLSFVTVMPAVRGDGTVELSCEVPPGARVAPHLFVGRGLAATPRDGKVTFRPVALKLTSFAEAGRTGSLYAVWLPARERLQSISLSPFFMARESWSRAGNVPGSIADGDVSTWRVTFNAKKRDEDWFAVERATPVTINTVTYAHGQCYHDGGWWDTRRGKPRIQIKRTARGKWEDVAAIDAYPATTAAKAPRLPGGRTFAVRFEPVKVVAIRVIGTPACGDNPAQSFASCAELAGTLAKAK